MLKWTNRNLPPLTISNFTLFHIKRNRAVSFRLRVPLAVISLPLIALASHEEGFGLQNHRSRVSSREIIHRPSKRPLVPDASTGTTNTVGLKGSCEAPTSRIYAIHGFRFSNTDCVISQAPETGGSSKSGPKIASFRRPLFKQTSAPVSKAPEGTSKSVTEVQSLFLTFPLADTPQSLLMNFRIR